MSHTYFEYGSEDERAALAAEALAESTLAIEEKAKALAHWHLRSSYDIFLEPYTQPDAIVPGLQIARGRPCGIVGAPGAGKNDFAQALALAIVSGHDAFGYFPVTRRGKVIHLTWDMGDYSTRIRYRRIANGMGLKPSDVEGMLALSPYPAMNLSHPNARKEFAKLLHGYDVCILDNARAATPGVDENSSLFGERITAFGQAAEDGGCIGIYLHHTRKASRDAEEDVNMESLRGTSAIAGASGAIWYVAPTEGIDSPRLVRMLRNNDLIPDVCDDFYLHHMKCSAASTFDAADLPPIKLVATGEPSPMLGNNPLHQRILEQLAVEPAGVNELKAQMGCRGETLREALGMLQDAGSIICSRAGRNSQVYSLTAKV